MKAKAAVRAIGGMLTIVVLLGLITADVLYPGVSLDPGQMQVLLLLIGALLGLDALVERFSGISIIQQEVNSNGGSESNDDAD